MPRWQEVRVNCLIATAGTMQAGRGGGDARNRALLVDG